MSGRHLPNADHIPGRSKEIPWQSRPAKQHVQSMRRKPFTSGCSRTRMWRRTGPCRRPSATAWGSFRRRDIRRASPMRLRQSEEGGELGGPAFRWDIALDLGDNAGLWDLPDDEQGKEVVRQLGVLEAPSAASRSIRSRAITTPRPATPHRAAASRPTGGSANGSIPSAKARRRQASIQAGAPTRSRARGSAIRSRSATSTS